ncbi:MAG: nucleotidyl transferase AbiEii/AbiGii toxin family protein [Candidatus Thermoplasmatota archaeon]
MLTRRQLQSFSTKAGVPLLTVERDYIQTLFLYELFTHSNAFIFKGGTCLRMAYNLNRYSEDLDFNYNESSEKAIRTLKESATRLNDFGIEGEIKKIESSFSGFTAKLHYKGPLYTGMERSVGTIVIDVSCRKEKVQTTSRPFRPVYDDCPSFILQCLSLEHLFAEKIRALLIRHKARDLYDVWFLQAMVDVDYQLINEKLKLYDTSLDALDIDSVFASLEKEWEQDLHALLGSVPSYQEIQQVVRKKLREWQKKS